MTFSRERVATSCSTFFWIFRPYSLSSSFFRENSRFRRKRVGTIFSFRTSMARLADRKIQTVFPIRTFFRSHDFSGFVSAQLQLCEIFHDIHVPIYRFIFKKKKEKKENPFPPRFKIPSIHFWTERLMRDDRTWRILVPDRIIIAYIHIPCTYLVVVSSLLFRSANPFFLRIRAHTFPMQIGMSRAQWGTKSILYEFRDAVS